MLNFTPRNGSQADFSDPLYLHPSDNPGMVLVLKVFNGTGFSTWKRSMMIALSPKSKVGLVNGALGRPSAISPDFRSWERCDDMVVL